MSTATLDVRALTEDELADLVSGEDDAARAAAVAELDRRDAEIRKLGARRMEDTAWAEAAHAQYVDADRECRGCLLSAKGKRAGITEWSLWSGPEPRARAWASPELNAYWDEHPRVTVSAWRQELAACRRDEQETAAREAAATGTETRNMGLIYAGLRAAQMASQAGQRQGMTHQQYQDNPAVQRARERMAAQAAVRAVAAQATREAHQQVVTRPAAETGKPVTGTVTAPAPRQLPDAPLLLRKALEETGLLITDYVAFPSRSAVIAIVLWIAQAAARHANRNPIWRAYPRLLLTSRENGSGKSTAGDVAAMLLQCRAGRMSKVTPYGLAKVLGGLKEAAIADDAQNVFRSDKAGAELLSVLINGYTPRATWVSGKNDGKVEPAAGPVMIMGKDELLTKRGDVLAYLFARSVIIRMERPARYMPEVDEEAEARAEGLGRALAAITGALGPQLRETARELAAENRGRLITEGDGGRTAQIWRPLLAVARVAGGRWPEAAQDAMAELAAASGDLLAAEEALEDDTLTAARASLSGAGRAFWDDEIQP